MARLSAAALRCYPPEAVRFRLAGEAHLSFCLGVDGQASAVKIARSSGSEVLDRAAAECVLPGALPLPGAAGCYELPVRFAARSP
ncbi:MAG TPA: TonB family protein [Myxococcaceae bacterium]|nr:TonB family protein [Myxococcaceae bacterium]